MSKSPGLLPDLPPVVESVPVMPALIAPVFPELAGNFSSMSPRGFEASSLLKKVFEVSRWATLIQDPSARRTKDSQPSGFGFEYCVSHVRFRVFQQTARTRATSSRCSRSNVSLIGQPRWGL